MAEIFVQLHEFDQSRLVVGPPVKQSFGKGKDTIKYYESEGFYKDNDGKLCKLYFQLPTQTVPGFSAMYPFGMKEDDRNPDVNMKGIQVCYPMTSMGTMDNPTEDEKYTFKVLDALFEASAQAMKRECSVKDRAKRKVSPATYTYYTTANAEGDWRGAMKPIYAYPKSKDDRKKEDRSKPQRSYIKLLTSGKGSNLICDTQIHGPGDRPLNPRTYMGARQKGKLTPVFYWKSIYWGSHGNESPYGASVQLRLAEGNYVPGRAQGPSRRMLPRNTAPVLDDDDSSFAPPSGEAKKSEDFPEMGSKNPADDLGSDTESGSASDGSEPEEKPKKPRKKAVRKKTPRRKRVVKN